MSDARQKIISKLDELIRTDHWYNEEEIYYSCPASEQYKQWANRNKDRPWAGSQIKEPICTCGVDEHNKKVEELRALLQKEFSP